MLDWLRKIFRHPERIDFSPALSRVKPIRVRLLAETDVERCCAIYRLNEPGRFPDGYFEVFTG